jgi:hypothetical protein
VSIGPGARSPIGGCPRSDPGSPPPRWAPPRSLRQPRAGILPVAELGEARRVHQQAALFRRTARGSSTATLRARKRRSADAPFVAIHGQAQRAHRLLDRDGDRAHAQLAERVALARRVERVLVAVAHHAERRVDDPRLRQTPSAAAKKREPSRAYPLKKKRS